MTVVPVEIFACGITPALPMTSQRNVIQILFFQERVVSKECSALAADAVDAGQDIIVAVVAFLPGAIWRHR